MFSGTREFAKRGWCSETPSIQVNALLKPLMGAPTWDTSNREAFAILNETM